MNAIEFPWLSAIILLPLVAALAIPLIPDKEGKTVRWYGLGVAIADFALIISAFWYSYDFQNPTLQLVENYAWVPQLGLNWSVGVDGLSMPLLLLTGLINTLAIFAAWKVTIKPRLFYALMLVMYSAQIGVFVAQDLLLFFLMWEIELVPVYLLISIWGGPKRRYAATKFILYTAAASIFILVAGFAMAFSGDTVTFDMATLGMKQYPKALELLTYAGFLIAFGVKMPIFPLHTWLPDAHGEASAPGSMILAGVLLKMGGYALIRFNVEMLPNAHVYFAPVLAVLGVVNIVYGACCAFAQTNLKRRLAYSSIAHMGFVLIGIASYTEIGISGAVLQMVSHGLIAASLFFLSGVTYERTHTLMMDKMGGMAKVMPRTFAVFTIGAMASLALPGMSGFVGELMVFLGIASSDVYSSSFKIVVILLSAVGVILTPIYLLSMLRQVFYGEQNAELRLDTVISDIKPRELFITACLIIPIIGIGFYPKLVTQTYDVKAVELAAHARQVLPVFARQQPASLYSTIFTAPTLASSEIDTLVNLSE
ncbi:MULTISPECIES: NAD(P)H-quinone oxidoreductase subunit 4 [Cyanophyceae]|uniref:NAD(P)H-quinone oxidoreductase subunit 4 n=1 Tax=Cyanophyceae TaxID=3028117 RepID=UPI00232DCF46|nr:MULTISPECIES: NAD(P)H-quinone oxidoreductase subunit 4 [Cyanophyceae]MDB9356220.1 NAD(P)H-quinone oxidoreductase subunit 4 [Nodularia spumigena CS-587/03]MDB9318437.1 NAD(P)H-quinone oxidoreductase subunit 4 [Nodularia spumigena CS-590/01A]MDB9322023.1 NAD(P)H-quinone oxidoreductase subunit 4 [Nodularia spumigena CS-591/07A]MDB9325497.1 NAD(P)H-quinone oxidoreductase subunit 4 [Nodularia spumigena CS-590/02]MDB9331567.1 NAD(P)H-quinone oxidoreductase subunit 4 [Nodularia spumigena CS-591/04